MPNHITSGITRWRTALVTMPPFAACRIKKAFSGLAPKTGLTGLTDIPLKFSGMRLKTVEVSAVILFIVCMRMQREHYG